MVCPCGSVICSCTQQCRCTDIRCICASCVMVREFRCEDCGYCFSPFYPPPAAEVPDFCTCQNIDEPTMPTSDSSSSIEVLSESESKLSDHTNQYGKLYSLKSELTVEQANLHNLLELSSVETAVSIPDNSLHSVKSESSILNTNPGSGYSDASNSRSVTNLDQMIKGKEFIKETSPKLSSPKHATEKFCIINFPETNQQIPLHKGVSKKDACSLSDSDSSSSTQVITLSDSDLPSEEYSDDDTKSYELKSEIFTEETELQNGNFSLAQNAPRATDIFQLPEAMRQKYRERSFIVGVKVVRKHTGDRASPFDNILDGDIQLTNETNSEEGSRTSELPSAGVTSDGSLSSPTGTDATEDKGETYTKSTIYSVKTPECTEVHEETNKDSSNSPDITDTIPENPHIEDVETDSTTNDSTEDE